MVDDAAPSTLPGRQIPAADDQVDGEGIAELSQQAARKFDFMTQLLQNLDALVYAELCTLYYMECSIFRFAVRFYGQSHWLTPKPDDYPLTMEAPRSQVISVFVPNLLCIILHIFSALPTAGEAARGYLHGGIIVDFVGQKPPTSRLTFLALDFIILAVQCLMLAVHSKREKLRPIIRSFLLRLPQALETQNTAISTQDHDAEERGMLRDAPGLFVEGAEIMEMQPLRVNVDGEPSNNAERRRERSQPSQHRSSFPSASGMHLLDVFSSGNGVLGEFHIFHTIRNATTDFRGAAGHSLQTLGYTAALTRLSAMRRMPRLEPNQRN